MHSFSTQFKTAGASFDGTTLTLSTGVVTRQWQLVKTGLATTLLRDDAREQTLCDAPENRRADWELFTISDAHPSQLVNCSTRVIEASSFTSAHLQVDMEFEIPAQAVGLRYRVDLYPGAPGLRSQLAVKALKSFDPLAYPHWLLESYSERLPLNCSNYSRHLAGYYNDTQHRYHRDLRILKEQSHRGTIADCEVHDWANLIALEDENRAGVILLKESHKCVNQPGIDTGHFKAYNDALISTGLGLRSYYLDGDESFSSDGYREAWATWCLLYSDGELGRQQSVKTFDALRFPFSYRRDGIITSNTWGSGGSGEGSRAAVNEASVLEEIERAAKLGIDCVQIDDGWQHTDVPGQEPERWHLSREKFPGGWQLIKERAAALNIKLGIWFPWYAPLEDMLDNINAGGFTQVKLDFLNAESRAVLDEFGAKAKTISEVHPEIQVNADLTERTPRFGYYFGRSYCSLFPQNIEMCHPDKNNMSPRHITYTPWLSLRQSWHYAKYMNLNQLQISLQNVDMIDPAWSDAAQHSHDYCFATTLMGLPLFFLETKYYSEAALQNLKPNLALYRNHREEMLKGTIYPIGEEPNNAATSGFQSHNEEQRYGYAVVFRELHAAATAEIALNFIATKKIKLTDLTSGKTTEFNADEQGSIPLDLTEPASWQLFRYAW